jgi:hypothetical protein
LLKYQTRIGDAYGVGVSDEEALTTFVSRVVGESIAETAGWFSRSMMSTGVKEGPDGAESVNIWPK